MLFRTAFGILVCAGLLAVAAPPKVPPESHGANDTAEISARLFLGRELVKQALGSDLDGYYIVVEVKLTPKDGNPLRVRRDDFVLKTDKDGERTTPFGPSQIAGAGVLVVSETSGGGGMATESPGPVWGGTMGRPGRLGGNGTTMGNTSTSTTQATVNDTSREKQNPVMRALS